MDGTLYVGSSRLVKKSYVARDAALQLQQKL